jgi:putative phage-type endonuclease
MNYPDCTIHRIPQRSEAWFALRRGVLTASRVGAWLLKSDATSTKARENAICELIAELAECDEEPDRFENWAMKRGTAYEPDAVAAFERATGKKVTDVGFCMSKHGLFGCSPDGLIEEDGSGLEGKVPIPRTHIAYRRAGILPNEYLHQVHFSMAVTGARSWWFQSWNPDLANLHIEVKRDEFTEKLLAAAIVFSRELKEAFEAERLAYREEFAA